VALKSQRKLAQHRRGRVSDPALAALSGSQLKPPALPEDIYITVTHVDLHGLRKTTDTAKEHETLTSSPLLGASSFYLQPTYADFCAWKMISLPGLATSTTIT